MTRGTVKALLASTSLAATLWGWGVLATRGTPAGGSLTLPPIPAVVQPGDVRAPAGFLPRAAAPAMRPLARTRSSR